MQKSVHKFERRNIVVDLDRCFIDIISITDYQLLPKIKRTIIEDRYGLKKKINSNMESLQFREGYYLVVIRPGTREFFKSLSKTYNLHICSFLEKDLIL